ncbi:MAG: hypothetical protein KC505_03130 [Myxococcales bacterium]|nr:hypothetical protein [Myxococcales bacterium]USN51145.1 MAG: hypothetical protein H6731_01670 [Myxococcales bacterium]
MIDRGLHCVAVIVTVFTTSSVFSSYDFPYFADWGDMEKIWHRAIPPVEEHSESNRNYLNNQQVTQTQSEEHPESNADYLNDQQITHFQSNKNPEDEFYRMANFFLTYYLFEYSKIGNHEALKKLLRDYPYLKVNSVDEHQKTPLDYAQENEYQNIIHLLSKRDHAS